MGDKTAPDPAKGLSDCYTIKSVLNVGGGCRSLSKNLLALLANLMNVSQFGPDGDGILVTAVAG